MVLTSANGYPYIEIGLSLICIRDYIFISRGQPQEKEEYMARKLGILAALISLVLLIRAAPGLADEVTLPGGDRNNLTWTETHGYNWIFNPVLGNYPGQNIPGFANGSISGVNSTAGTTWVIGTPYTTDDGILKSTLIHNSVAQPQPAPVSDGTTNEWTSVKIATDYGLVTTDLTLPNYNYWTTITVVYDKGPFSVSVSGNPLIQSTDTVITTAGTYQTTADGSFVWLDSDADNPDDFGYQLQNRTLMMTGSGTNSLDGTPFTFSAIMNEVLGDNTHDGTFTDFKVLYGADSSPVPIPGAMWLLGSGLFGLACLRPRRRKHA